MYLGLAAKRGLFRSRPKSYAAALPARIPCSPPYAAGRLSFRFASRGVATRRRRCRPSRSTPYAPTAVYAAFSYISTTCTAVWSVWARRGLARRAASHAVASRAPPARVSPTRGAPCRRCRAAASSGRAAGKTTGDFRRIELSGYGLRRCRQGCGCSGVVTGCLVFSRRRSCGF